MAARDNARPTRGQSRQTVKSRPPLGQAAWLEAAREALIREGIGGVQVGKLARRLKATRGGFYWFFDNRAQLLDALLIDWERTTTEAFRAALGGSERNGMAEFHAVIEMMLAEKQYSPAWDAAIRDWARLSTKVAKAVRRVDAERIAVHQQIYLDMGCDEDEAYVRARITYFHQVGYDTVGMQEVHERRMRLLPLYVRYLTGR